MGDEWDEGRKKPAGGRHIGCPRLDVEWGRMKRLVVVSVATAG